MSETLADRRTAPRHKVLKGGTVVFDRNDVPCTVRNLSSTGAALELASSISLPPSFTLVIKGDQSIRHCRRVWNREKRIGVAFD